MGWASEKLSGIDLGRPAAERTVGKAAEAIVGQADGQPRGGLRGGGLIGVGLSLTAFSGYQRRAHAANLCSMIQTA